MPLLGATSLPSPAITGSRPLEKVAELAALPRPAFEAIKANRVEGIRIRYEENHKKKDETFLHCWFTEQTQGLLAEAAKKFWVTSSGLERLTLTDQTITTIS
jgi:hypothetical protein